MAKRIGIMAAVLALLAGLAAPAGADPAAVSERYRTPALLKLQATALECNNKGSTVEFSGTLTVGGLSILVTFKNNWKGTHTLETVGEANFEVTPANGKFSIPKQPVLGGVGGNPWISVAFDNDPDGERIVLGRCVQGAKLNKISKKLLLPASAKAIIEALQCSNKGSKISLSTSDSKGGVDATLYLDNNINKVVHQAETDAEVKFSLFPPVVVPKQGSLGGPGGNPLISVQFLGSDGPIGDEHELGRCVKLR